MTIDERIQFLTQSAESHDRQIGEFTEQVTKLGSKVDQLGDSVDRLTARFDGLVSMMAELLGAVKTIAEGVGNHERRIGRLEAL
jgi:uncharacterized coiled-coil protein SlyX